MEVQAILQQISENLMNKASVNTVFGEPVVVEGKKVIPVAKVGCGFGGGGGGMNKRESTQDGRPQAGGGGGGGGFRAVPVGVVEITPNTTRFIRFGSNRRLIGAVALGILMGMVIRGRLRR